MPDDPREPATSLGGDRSLPDGDHAADATRAELEAVARQWISLWCVPVDWDLFDKLHADDFEDCSAAGRSPSKAAFARGLLALVEAFPDLVTKVEDLIVDTHVATQSAGTTGKIAIRWSAMGTNHRAFLGKGPTKRCTVITGIEIIDVHAGRIVRRWGEWDITAHR